MLVLMVGSLLLRTLCQDPFLKCHSKVRTLVMTFDARS